MKKILLPFFIFFFNYSFSQWPYAKQWDYRYGSPETEWLLSTYQTADSGFILIGYIVSANSGGDVTDSTRGHEDFWMVKTDKDGIKQWDKRYGGTKNDGALDGIPTSDGGYMLAGFSLSDSGYEKSQNNWDTTLQTADYWVVKTDSLGNKIWDKRFGGTGNDAAEKIIATTDGNYLVAGSSGSDANGDKTQSNQGLWDYWIIKIDPNGNKIWDKRYGGNTWEDVYNLYNTPEGGYLVVGNSYSAAGGDKTQANWDPTLHWGDEWMVKLDSAGNKIWDRTYGGINEEFISCVFFKNNGNYLICGSSKSGISGDRTIANYDPAQGFNATWDFWILETDSTGTIVHEKVFGGISSDELYNMIQLSDGNFLFSGDSYSPISGDKTENNLGGPEATWLIKTDPNLNIIWDKTILTISPPGSAGDEIGTAFQTNDGCILIRNTSSSGIGGYKSQPNWAPNSNFPDYWIVKFCDTTSVESISEIDNHQLVLYPNPTTGKLILGNSVPAEYSKIEIFNLLGEKVFATIPISGEIDISSLPPGIYILQATDGEKIFRGKIAKD